MKITNTVPATPKLAITGLITLALVFSLSACNDDTPLTGVDTNRTYTQIERLGNPLVSEVFFPKRDHGLHNNKGPSDDTKTMDQGGTDVRGHIRAFVSSFGPTRTETTIATLSAVLAPDMLMVFPNRSTAAGNVGWLTWALKPNVGYGGRLLTDDVVDVGLSSVFGNALDPSQPVLAGLTSDNVGPSVRSFSATFPYLETARP
ncbi:MAG: DUF4331 family protein [Gemmatimonadaceae bacterium]